MNLVAVQPEVSCADYVSAASFRQKIMGLAEEAVAGLSDAPTLLAYPELIGFPLLLTLSGTKSTLGASIKNVLSQHWCKMAKAAWQHRHVGLSIMYLPVALAAYSAYTSTFQEVAKTFKVTVVAGSSLLPEISHEPLQGMHIVSPSVYNTAFVFSPQGRLLGQTHKVHLTPGLESRMGLSRGRWQDLRVVYTPVGRVGVAICLDAFHDSVIGHLDGLGAQIVVQPSANHALWNRPWPGDTGLTEGQAWFRYGLSQTLQGSQSVRYGVNPMLTGDLWDLRFEGCSSILAVGSDKVEVIAQAPSVRETWVRATVNMAV